jgi:hypothetical protein
VEGVIDADPIAAAVRAVMVARTEWTGTASELLGALVLEAGERVTKSKTWPDSPRALAGRLRRASTFLRKIGIEISFGREPHHPHRHHSEPFRARKHRGATVHIVRTVRVRAEGQSRQWVRCLTPADGREDGCGLDGASTVRSNPLKTNGETAADGADANRPSQSTPEKSGAPGWRALSAAEALKAARAAGIRVGIDGDDLVIEAPTRPPDAVMAAV